MCMRMLCSPEAVGGKGGAALLLLRLVAGPAFILHGWPKIQHAFNWMGPDAAMPGFLQALAALSEFGGGIALVLGLLTRLAALGIACTMFVAVFMIHMPRGDAFVATGPGQGSYELAAVYLVIMLVFLLRGAGAYSLDAKFCAGKH